MRYHVTSIFLNVFEPWTLTAELKISIQAMEMMCYYKILRTSYKDYVSNEQAIGPREDLTMVKRYKLQWYDHVSRSSGLARPSCKAQ